MSEYKHCQGRTPYESSDCVVRALTVAASIEYRSAWYLLNDAGRKPNRGTSDLIWIPVFKTFNLCLDEHLINQPPYPMDNVIVCTPKHLYAIHNMKHSDIGHEQYLKASLSAAHLHCPKTVIRAWHIPKTK